MDIESLKHILKRIKNDDELSFRVLFDFYYERFFRIAHYYVKNNENAEEVVMDVFTKFWKSRKKLPEIINFNNYVYSSVKNQSLNYLNKNRIDTESLDDYTSSKMIEYVEPENLFLGKELAKDLEKVVSSLPPRCQLIYRMIREDGIKYKEVAETLDISLKAVENQMLIAMKRIRSVLEVYQKEKSQKRILNKLNVFICMALFFCVS